MNTTEQLKIAFLDTLPEAWTISNACRKLKISRTNVYSWRKDDPAFAIALEAAQEEAIELLEAKAHQKAAAGLSDNLTMFLLKGARPHKYRDNININANVLSANVQLSPEQYALIFQASIQQLPPPNDVTCNSATAPATLIPAPPEDELSP